MSASPAPLDASLAPTPIWRWIALAGYPIIIVLALITEQPQLRALTMPLLAIALVGPWPDQIVGRVVLGLSVAAAVVVMIWPTFALWPPGLICLSAAVWFAVSLLPGHQPRIHQFAALAVEHHQQSLPVDSDRWLRGWTWAWTIALTGLALGALALAAAQQAMFWLMWVVVVMPLVMLGLLLGELYLRRWRFPDEPRWSALFFLRTMARIHPGQLD